MTEKCQISINRASSGSGPNYIRIELRPAFDRRRRIRITMPLLQFAEVLTGLSEVDCEIEGLENPDD